MTHAVGAHRAVLRLANRTGLPVGRADIDELVHHGALQPAGEHNGWPVYRCDDLDAVPAALVATVVTERATWLADSLDARTAASVLGIPERSLRSWAQSNGLTPGRFDRYPRTAVAALADARPTSSPPITQWARHMLTPDVAVILDTETTDLHGAICEIAVIDAATGTTLLDTLVNPGLTITPAAQAVHHLTDTDLTCAPRWPEALPTVLHATHGRIIISYNAGYDRRTVLADCARHQLAPGPLADPHRWHCLMHRHATHLGTDRPPPLGGPHRALPDCHTALALLRHLAAEPDPTHHITHSPPAADPPPTE